MTEGGGVAHDHRVVLVADACSALPGLLAERGVDTVLVTAVFSTTRSSSATDSPDHGRSTGVPGPPDRA